MSSAPVSHLVFAACDGGSYAGSYHVDGDRVFVRSRFGAMSARCVGDPGAAARALLQVIVSLWRSARQAAGDR